MEREAGRRNAEVVQQHAPSRGGAHLLFQQELTSEELGSARRGLVSTLEEGVLGRKRQSSVVFLLCDFTILVQCLIRCRAT